MIVTRWFPSFQSSKGVNGVEHLFAHVDQDYLGLDYDRFQGVCKVGAVPMYK